MNVKIETKVNKSFQGVMGLLDRNLFLALNPPWVQMKILRFDGMRLGDEVHLKINLGVHQTDWISKTVESKLTEHEFNFVDVGVKMLPGLKSWHHRHIFRALNESQTLIIDDIEFTSSNKWLDKIFQAMFYVQFGYRKIAYKKYLI